MPGSKTLTAARGSGQSRWRPGSYAGTEILDANPDEAWPAWETSDAVFVSEPYAFRSGVGVGNVITLATDNGPRNFTVAATFQSYDTNASAVMISRARMRGISMTMPWTRWASISLTA